MAEYNWDALGLAMRPTSGKMLEVIDSSFQHVVDWVKKVIWTQHGQIVTEVKLEPNVQLWQFYADNLMIANLEHDWMIRAKLALDTADEMILFHEHMSDTEVEPK